MHPLKLVIGNKNYSSWSLRPWFFLKNLGLDFEEELVYLYENNTDENLSPYFSNKKVPLLIDSNDPENILEVWDSLAIIEYIADSSSQGWPKSGHARSIARSLSAEMHSSFDALRNAMPMNCRKQFPDFVISDDVQQDIDRIVSLWEFSSKNYASTGPWLLGEFSGADAMYAPIVLRLNGYGAKLTGFAADYVAMALENKYMKEWVEAGVKETHIIDDDEIVLR